MGPRSKISIDDALAVTEYAVSYSYARVLCADELIRDMTKATLIKVYLNDATLPSYHLPRSTFDDTVGLSTHVKECEGTQIKLQIRLAGSPKALKILLYWAAKRLMPQCGRQLPRRRRRVSDRLLGHRRLLQDA